MGGGQSVIVQGEDIKTKYDAGIIDLSFACEKDVICPPSKFISTFSNYNNNNNNQYQEKDRYNDYLYFLIIPIIILLMLIFIKKKYI